MGILKRAWQGMRRPEQANPYTQQYAAHLMSGGGSRAPISKLAARLMGGLLMGGQNWAQAQQAEKRKADRTEAVGLLRSGAKVPEQAQTAATGILAATPFVGPMAGTVAEGMKGVLAPQWQESQRWDFIEKAMQSDDPQLQRMAGRYIDESVTEGPWEKIQLPTGELMMWQKGHPETLKTIRSRTERPTLTPDEEMARVEKLYDNKDVGARSAHEAAAGIAMKPGFTGTFPSRISDEVRSLDTKAAAEDARKNAPKIEDPKPDKAGAAWGGYLAERDKILARLAAGKVTPEMAEAELKDRYFDYYGRVVNPKNPLLFTEEELARYSDPAVQGSSVPPSSVETPSGVATVTPPASSSVEGLLEKYGGAG